MKFLRISTDIELASYGCERRGKFPLINIPLEYKYDKTGTPKMWLRTRRVRYDKYCLINGKATEKSTQSYGMLWLRMY